MKLVLAFGLWPLLRWNDAATAFEYVLVNNNTLSNDTVNASGTAPASSTSTGEELPKRRRETVVLYPNEYLVRGEYRYSPSGKYRAGLSEEGDFVVEDLNLGVHDPLVVWTTGLAAVADGRSSSGSVADVSCGLQRDGNLVIRNAESRELLWSTKTYGYPASQLVIDDDGQAAVVSDSNRLWFGGVPRDYYADGRTFQDLTYPIRATFYYPW
jgi:hypothetical protein